MAKKLNKEDKEFVKKVAKDSYDMIINVEDIRKAFKLIMDDDQVPMQRMRQELFKVLNNPDSIEETESEGLPVPDRFKKRMEEELTVKQKQELYQKALDGDQEAKKLLHEDYDKGFEESLYKPLEREAIGLGNLEEKKIDKRSKEYRDSLKNGNKDN